MFPPRFSQSWVNYHLMCSSCPLTMTNWRWLWEVYLNSQTTTKFNNQSRNNSSNNYVGRYQRWVESLLKRKKTSYWTNWNKWKGMRRLRVWRGRSLNKGYGSGMFKIKWEVNDIYINYFHCFWISAFYLWRKLLFLYYYITSCTTSRNPGGRLNLIVGMASLFISARHISSCDKVNFTASFSLSVLFPPLCFSLMCKFNDTSEP